jgi:hypothetical protein
MIQLKSFMILGLGLLLSMYAPQAPAQSNPHANLIWDGPGTCLTCHEPEARTMHGSVHYQWQGEAPFMTGGPALQGKLHTSVNSYCINILGNWQGCSTCHVGLGAMPEPQVSQAQLENIDCLICHQAGYKRKKVNGVFVPDLQNMTITMDQAVKTVHIPGRENCIQCHAKGGGGDNFKRGDLSLAHSRTTDKNFDVHMATTGANLNCQACHDFTNHRVAGRGSDLRETDSMAPISCSTSECHPNKATARGHRTSAVNRHVARVACQTCHIPVYARNAADSPATEATEVYRTWLEPHLTATGALHPTSTLMNNLVPEYRFWNKFSTGYSLYDKVFVDPETGRYPTSRPMGMIDDPTTESKLYPFKYKTALQPMATDTYQLIAMDTKVYFSTGDAQAAVRSGLINMGYSGNEPYDFVETDTFQLITHEVPPSSQVLTCSKCHGSTSQMNLKEVGYVLKGSVSVVCSQCHSASKARENKSFTELHKEHVTEEGYDCSWCHTFSRPERNLTQVGSRRRR